MNRKVMMNYLAAFLLIIAAVWNITVHSGNDLGESDKIDRQAHRPKFCERQNDAQGTLQYYLHINSKPYKQSLKMDTLFAQRLDSIDKERLDSIERQAKTMIKCRVHCRK